MGSFPSILRVDIRTLTHFFWNVENSVENVKNSLSYAVFKISKGENRKVLM